MVGGSFKHSLTVHEEITEGLGVSFEHWSISGTGRRIGGSARFTDVRFGGIVSLDQDGGSVRCSVVDERSGIERTILFDERIDNVLAVFDYTLGVTGHDFFDSPFEGIEMTGNEIGHGGQAVLTRGD